MLKTLLAGMLFINALGGATARADDQTLKVAVDNPHRSAANKARDKYRHPLQTLSFFGLRPDASVVEIWPGGGYWTETLAFFLKDKGHYTAAVGGHNGDVTKFQDQYGKQPDAFGKIDVVAFDPTKADDLGPAGSQDFVFTFRNVHNWMSAGTADRAFADFYKVLKKGGILGVEEHRGDPAKPQDPKGKSGYVREDYVVALAKKAGFTIVAKADINGNPKDTKDYPEGVWTLPPTLRLKDKDRAKYEAIGESDRMTLMFRK